MRLNPAYLPWLSICTVLGAGIGYLAGGGRGLQASSVPILYGMLAGLFVGMTLSIAIRVRERRRRAGDAATAAGARGEGPPDTGSDRPPEAGT